MEKVEHLKVCLTTDENDWQLNNNEISCKDVLKRKGTRETKTQPQIVHWWIWKKRWWIIVATVLLLFMLMVACGGMLISLMVGHDSVSKGYQGQRKQSAQHALSIGKLEKEIVILSKDLESFRNQLVELRKRHQEDINRLEIHVTENSKNIVDLTNKTKQNGISIERLQTSNLQLSEKIQALDVRLSQTQKQMEMLRTTINRLEQDILRNANRIDGLTNKTNTNGVSIEQLQMSNLQLSEKIQAFDVRLSQTQKQKEILRTTINRLEQEILRNTNQIKEMAREKTQTQGNTENSQHRPASSGQSSLKPPEFLFLIAFLYITTLLVCQMMETNK